MNRIVAITSVILLSTACGSFEPAEGTWTIDSQAFSQDSCGTFGEGDSEVSALELAMNSDGSFGLADPDTDVELRCQLNGASYVCGTHEIWQPGDGVDASFGTIIDASGEFADEQSMTGSWDIALDCDGPDCDGLGAQLGWTFPCTVVLDFAASL